jgi:hypothetical protein
MSRYRVSQTFPSSTKKKEKVHQPGNERITTFSSSKHIITDGLVKISFFFFFIYGGNIIR